MSELFHSKYFQYCLMLAGNGQMRSLSYVFVSVKFRDFPRNSYVHGRKRNDTRSGQGNCMIKVLYII